MAVNFYEGLFILDSGLYARDPELCPNKINNAIAEAGGEVAVSRIFEERRLAYPINGQRKGVYWLVYFRMQGTKLVELDRQLKLIEGNVRHMILKQDPRLADILVENALNGQIIQSHADAVEEEVEVIEEVASFDEEEKD